jgi:hypothetical protein
MLFSLCLVLHNGSFPSRFPTIIFMHFSSLTSVLLRTVHAVCNCELYLGLSDDLYTGSSFVVTVSQISRVLRISNFDVVFNALLLQNVRD